MEAGFFKGGKRGSHIDGYDETGYSIGDDGEVMNISTDVNIHPSTDEDGDPYVILNINGKNEKALVSELVASAYVPNPDDLPNVRHIDGDKTNNDFRNLEWSYFPDDEAWSSSEIEKETSNASKMLFKKDIKDLSKEEVHKLRNYMKDKLNTWVLQEIENPKTGQFFISDYIVNPMGDVYNVKKKRFVEHKLNKYGYELVDLGIGKIRVDHLVADNFSGVPVYYDMKVIHKDGNKLNNWVENLEIVL